MEADFINAANGYGHRVLGVTLRPFSIGHYLILSSIESPYIPRINALKAGVSELLTACLICSKTFQAGRFALDHGTLGAEIKAWKRELGVVSVATMAEAHALFMDYVANGMKQPKIWTSPDSAGADLGSPWIQLLRVNLMSGMNMSPAEVDDYPIALAWWDCMTLREIKSMEKVIYSDADKEADQAMKELNGK